MAHPHHAIQQRFYYREPHLPFPTANCRKQVEFKIVWLIKKNQQFYCKMYNGGGGNEYTWHSSPNWHDQHSRIQVTKPSPVWRQRRTRHLQSVVPGQVCIPLARLLGWPSESRLGRLGAGLLL